GLALANLKNTAGAEQERTAWQAAVSRIPPDTMYDQLNKTGAVFKVHEHLLAGGGGRRRRDDKGAIDLFHAAVAAEDALNYSEPPPWYPPVRPMLGRVLLELKQWPEAE